MYFRDEEKLRHYLEASPKARIWVSKLGIEKTVRLSRKVFLPLGCMIAMGLLGFGILNLAMIVLNR